MILGVRKYYRYKNEVDAKQEKGLITPFMVTTSRGNRVFAVKIDAKKHIRRKDEYGDPYV